MTAQLNVYGLLLSLGAVITVTSGALDTCMRYRVRSTLSGSGIFRGRMVGIAEKECFAKCARDAGEPPCRAAYAFQTRKRGSRPLLNCIHYTADSTGSGVKVVKSPRNHWLAKLAEVRRPCAANKLQAKPGSFNPADDDLTDVSFADADFVRDDPREFGAWAAWSGCSSSCGESYRSRQRNCVRNCDGTASKIQLSSQACEAPSCNAAVISPPSASANKAPVTAVSSQAQFRQPPGGTGTAYQPTAYQPSPAAQPSRQLAPWGNWGAWSQCPQYGCENVQMQRSRACGGYGGKGCQGDAAQQQPCQCAAAQPTPAWTAWSPWTDCGTTCGSGQKSRSRSCSVPGQCAGAPTETQRCDLPSCSYWREWARWGPCSKTCGNGQRTQSRVCAGGGCVGPRVNSEACNEGPCPQWEAWSSYGACSATCGSGQRQRDRACSHGTLCDGAAKQADNCPALPPCPTLSPWSAWSDCSRTCGPGKKRRIRECRYGNPSDCSGSMDEMSACEAPPCPLWAAWAAWTPCSSTCGRGTVSRQRDCQYGTNCAGTGYGEQSCEAGPCAEWTQWAMWGACSQSCGDGGLQERTRSCRNGAAGLDCRGSALDGRECSPSPTPCPVWADWAGWGDCSATCGSGGKQQRTRGCQYGQSCAGGAASGYDAQPCNLPTCAEWTAWQAWGPCTTTCGGGVSERTRECRGGLSGLDCPGSAEAVRQCAQEACPAWRDWEAWTPCSATCGNGQQQRARSCTYGQCDAGPASATESCYAGPCPTPPPAAPACAWMEWGALRACSVTCGSGTQTRTRICSCYGGCPITQGLGKVQSQPCEMGPCGGYGGKQFAQFYAARNRNT